MSRIVNRKAEVDKARDIVRDAGGRVVGRTRLQKIAYLLELAGLGDGFEFEYRHYGPYSEDLATAARNAHSMGFIHEDEQPTSWGGFYSIFTTEDESDDKVLSSRKELAQLAVKADPIELELAATAAYLAVHGESNPWQETARRKPDKVEGTRLNKARALYRKLREIDTPDTLPDLN